MSRFIILFIFLYSCSQSSEYHLKRGNRFFMLGDYYKAIDMYTTAILKKPDYAEAYLSRAMAYEKIGNRTKAMDDYLKAITYNPKYVAAYNNLASLYIESSLYENAYTYIQKAIEINPSYKYGYYNRGLIHYYTKRYNDAISDFTKTIELSKNDMPLAYYYRALAYSKLAMYDNAIADLEYLINSNNSNDVVYYTLAKILYHLEPLKALDNINKAIELKEEHFYYYLRSKINDKLLNIDKAIDDINLAIKISNLSNSEYLYYSCELYLKVGDKETAKKHCDMALELAPMTKDIYNEKIKLITKGKK